MTLAEAPPAPAPAAPALSRLRTWGRTFGRAPRIMGLDVARALAVIAMIAAHAGAIEEEFRLFSPATWPGIVHGYPSLLFALLAGFSVSLLTRRGEFSDEEAPAMRLRMLGRGAAIFVIGLLLELLSTPIAVILTLYGVLYVALIPALRWRTSRLVVAALTLGLGGPLLLALVRGLSLGTMGSGLGLVTFGAYPITVWLFFALVGMALARLPLQRTATAIRFVVVGAVLALAAHTITATARGLGYGSAGASGSSGGDGAQTQKQWPGMVDGWPDYFNQIDGGSLGRVLLNALLDPSAHSGSVLELTAATGVGLLVIGLCQLAAKPLRWVLLPLAALGSMPLSAYSAHVLSYFAVAAPGGMLFSTEFVTASAVVLLIAATVWSVFRGRGPLETLVARIAAAAARLREPAAERARLGQVVG